MENIEKSREEIEKLLVLEKLEKLKKNKGKLWSDVIHLSENLLFFKFYIAVYEELNKLQNKYREEFKKESILVYICFSSNSTYFSRLTKDNFYNASLVCIRRLIDNPNRDNISLKVFVGYIKMYAISNNVFDKYQHTFDEYDKIKDLIDKARNFINQNIAHRDNNQKDHSDFKDKALPYIERITKGLQTLFRTFWLILENTAPQFEYRNEFPSFLFHYKLDNPYEPTPEAKLIYKSEIIKRSEDDRLKFNSKKLEIENFIKEIEANYIKKWNELKKEIYST